MKAHARSLRIAPKKANLIAQMVRGMTVAAALSALARTNKKAARMVETLLKSALANAGHNDKQEVQNLVIRTIIVNQGAGYRRGVPMARGRMRPMRKFLSHISITLGIADGAEGKKRAGASQQQSSAVKKEKKSPSRTKKTETQAKQPPESLPSV